MTSMYGQQGLRGPTGSFADNITAGSTPMGNKVPSGYKRGQLQNFTPEMMQLFQTLFEHVSPGSYLSRLASGDENMLKEIQAPAWRDFNQRQSQLASRFTGFGGQGSLSARGGSGFKNYTNQQEVDFATNMAAQRHQLMQNSIHELMGLSGNLLNQRPYENFLVKKPQNRTAELIGKLGGAIPGLISAFTGGGSAGDALRGAFSSVPGFGGGGGNSYTNEMDLGFRSGAPGYW